jgi:hypothetical protein
MTVRKPAPPDAAAELIPHFSYRLNSPVVIGVLGLGRSQIDDAIERGELEPPIKLTASGRARAYTGSQLLRIQRRRLAQVATKEDAA